MKKLIMVSGLLTSLALIVSPAGAHDSSSAQASDQAALEQFMVSVRSIEANLPSRSSDAAKDGAKCSSELDALIKKLPPAIVTNFRCDVDGTDVVVIRGGAQLRR